MVGWSWTLCLQYISTAFERLLEHLPNGPSITTVGRAAEGAIFLLITGGRTLNLTSGGIDNGARPICDGRHVEAENGREGTIGNAGSKKAGNETEVEVAIALSSPFDRAVENIASILSSYEDAEVRDSVFWRFPFSLRFSHTRDRESLCTLHLYLNFR
jgi:hypothetical protein